MKRIVSIFAMFIAFVGFLPTQAFAQPYGTWAYCGGLWRFGSCNGPTQVGIPSNQLVAMPSYGPGYYQNQGAIMRCRAPVWGALAGGTLGSLAKHHTAQATILGAIAGGVGANELFCERVGVVQAAPAPIAAPYYQRGYAGNGSGGVRCTVRSVAGGSEIKKTINVMSPADCEALSGFVEDAKQQMASTEVAERPLAAEVSGQKYKLEETSRSSGSDRNNCVLRVRGKVVAEQEVPDSDKDDAKSFCDRWQRQEARARGLI